MWTRLFTTAVIPVALLLYFNSRIFIDLLNSKVPERGDIRGASIKYVRRDLGFSDPLPPLSANSRNLPY